MKTVDLEVKRMMADIALISEELKTETRFFVREELKEEKKKINDRLLSLWRVGS